jgi:toxin-antitoxin system PIN domain toxin
VIVLDVNILLAAHRDDHPHHELTRPWFDELIASGEPFAIPGVVWGSFIRVSTNRRIFTIPTPIADAFGFMRAVRQQSQHISLEPGERHLDLFEELCVETESAGDLTVDAYLAAFAIEHGAALASLDRDFARFPSLTWVRPGD